MRGKQAMHFSLVRVVPRYMRFLVGAGFHALAIAAAALLVDEHDAVFGPLVDRVARAGGEAGGIDAMIADAREIEEPGLVLAATASPPVEVLPLCAFLVPVG